MSILLIEPEPATRSLLEDLVDITLSSIPLTAVGQITRAPLKNGVGYDAIVLRLDSIQGLEDHIAKYTHHGTLLIQASFRLAEPGAGVRIASLKKKGHLLCEIDQNSPDWPLYLIRSLYGHFEILPRISELYENRREIDRPGLEAAAQMRLTLRLVEEHKVMKVKPAKQYVDTVPASRISNLMSEARSLNGLSKYFQVFSSLEELRRPLPPRSENLPDKFWNATDLARKYADSLDSCFELLKNSGRKPGHSEMRVWLVRDEEMHRNFRSPFFYRLPSSFAGSFHGPCLVLPVPCDSFGRILKAQLPTTMKETRPIMRRELTHLLNDAEQPNFPSDWNWLDLALGRWFEGRYLAEDSFEEEGLRPASLQTTHLIKEGCEIFYRKLPHRFDLPFDHQSNLGMAVRFLQFLERRRGIQEILKLWRLDSINPLEICHQRQWINEYFDWLLEEYWEDAIAGSKSLNGSRVEGFVARCSCHLWQIPGVADYITLKFNEEGASSVKATVVRRSDRKKEELRPEVAFQLGNEERILMIQNVWHRRNKNANDDGLRYQLEIGGRG